ncbi:hypothetical protein HPP92_015029 [Vanilla planifolia]|uniref:GDSL esterase/lipase n=1 Tax=Vanilla planifolia TaxID=51239 RepID=A0A835UVD7_VANPL|nr:hypothetical protein HPP92_015029 [Vanilla planifolia]
MKRGSGSVVHIPPFVSLISFLLPTHPPMWPRAGYVHLWRLTHRQWQQQLHTHHCEGQLLALRHRSRLPYRTLLQWPHRHRLWSSAFGSPHSGAILELAIQNGRDHSRGELRVGRRRHSRRHRQSLLYCVQGARITFNGQIALFEKTVRLQLPLLIPDPKKLSDYLASSMFVINIGSNDYINNYLLPNLYPSSRIYSAAAFADLLIENLASQLMSLYRLGARKMVIVGVGPLGCIPSQLFQQNSTDGSCIDGINNAVSIFNNHLMPLMSKLNSTLSGSFFILENIYKSFLDMVQRPSSYGFTENNMACCGNGKYGGELSCLPLQKPCLQRINSSSGIRITQPRQQIR